jgi:hypothetical protein
MDSIENGTAVLIDHETSLAEPRAKRAALPRLPATDSTKIIEVRALGIDASEVARDGTPAGRSGEMTTDAPRIDHSPGMRPIPSVRLGGALASACLLLLALNKVLRVLKYSRWVNFGKKGQPP